MPKEATAIGGHHRAIIEADQAEDRQTDKEEEDSIEVDPIEDQDSIEDRPEDHPTDRETTGVPRGVLLVHP